MADGFDEAPEGCLPSMYKLYGAVKKAYPNLRTMATFSGFSHVPTDLPVDGESCSSRYVSFRSLKSGYFHCAVWVNIYQWYYYAKQSSPDPPASVTARRAAGKEYWWCKRRQSCDVLALRLF